MDINNYVATLTNVAESIVSWQKDSIDDMESYSKTFKKDDFEKDIHGMLVISKNKITFDETLLNEETTNFNKNTDKLFMPWITKYEEVLADFNTKTKDLYQSTKASIKSADMQMYFDEFFFQFFNYKSNILIDRLQQPLIDMQNFAKNQFNEMVFTVFLNNNPEILHALRNSPLLQCFEFNGRIYNNIELNNIIKNIDLENSSTQKIHYS